MKNQINIIGRLGKDPEKRFTSTGQEVCNFSVATDRTWKKDEEKMKETIWFRVEVWGKLAGVCATWLKKGSLVDIEGRMKPIRIYKDASGESQAQLEIAASNVTFLSSTKTSDEASSGEPVYEDISGEVPF